MKILKEKKSLKEDFIELAEFSQLRNVLSDCAEDIQGMYKSWYKASKNMGDEDLEYSGYKSFKEMDEDCRDEVNGVIQDMLFVNKP